MRREIEGKREMECKRLAKISIFAVVIILVVQFATPLLYWVPKPALAAIVITVVSEMIDIHVPIRLWKVRNLAQFCTPFTNPCALLKTLLI